MIDVNKQLKIVAKTGKLEFGCKETLDAARTGKAKLIILASNCPQPYVGDILHNASLSEVPVYTYQGTGLDLGVACEKLFVVSALAVRESGDSEILKLKPRKMKDVDT